MKQGEGEEVRSRGGNHLSTIRKSTNASKCAHKFQNEKTDSQQTLHTASGWAAAATVADAASTRIQFGRRKRLGGVAIHKLLVFSFKSFYVVF